ncbi:hypothetical protein WA026_001992 [Henosepilachna vigintioctopunctata]|uniref:Protein phosphatase 1 regulatory subunit 35 C-terminal domain-containing protein n=1 Tax=Henosepilachna vigintioctopunctata TaxID=420089 RepID=A0AAW1UJT6_9CUCU
MMNRDIKTSCKKQLIRNPVVKNSQGIVIKNTKPIVPPIDLYDMDFEESPKSQLKQVVKKTKFNIPEINESLKSLSLSPSLKHNSKTDIHATESKKSLQSGASSKLNVPRMHSSLNISKKVDKIGKMETKFKSAPEIRNAAYQEILSRQVNFPYQKKIYKDLIPLSSPNQQRPTIICTRNPMPPKDREPILENFIEIKPVKEYSYIPDVKLEDTKGSAHCRSLQIYKYLKMCSETILEEHMN